MDNPTPKEVALTALTVQFAEFLKRYERDLEETREWRDRHDVMLAEHGKMLEDIMPNYRRGLWVVSIIVVGSIGFMVKAFWSHIAWR